MRTAQPPQRARTARTATLASLITGLLLGFAQGCGGDRQPDEANLDTGPARTTVKRAADRAGPPRTRKPTRPARAKRRSRTTTEPNPFAPEPATIEEQPDARAEPEAAPPGGPKTKRPNPAPAEPEPRIRAIKQTATLTMVRREGTTYLQQGPVTGTLTGEMTLHATLGGPGVTATFTVHLDDGTMKGRGSAKLRPRKDGSSADFTGTATITTGTGAHKGVTANDMRFSGNVAADGSKSTVWLSGDLLYRPASPQR